MGAVLEHGLYVITDCEKLPPADLLAKSDPILQAGIAALQYRNKRDPYAARRGQALALREVCRRYGTPFIVNDDLELAMEVGADGVHLGRDDPSCAEARSRLGAHALIGVSCYDSINQGLATQQAGASYVAFGAFFPTTTKIARAAPDIGLLRQARAALDLPIVAIGGIKVDNAAALLEAGADVLAVVSSVYGAADPARAVREFNALFERHLNFLRQTL